MDHDPAELSRERAASSEPCSTRPKPFDDNEVTSRKRQRVSRGGSRSRSADNARASIVTQDSMDLQEESVNSEAEAAPPQTPTRSGPDPPQPEPNSSRVTINLRTSRPLDSIPSSPPSPTSSPRMINGGEESSTRISVESGSDELSTIPAIETPTSSPSAVGSPEIEVLAVNDEDDFGPHSPPVAIINDDDVFEEQVRAFPYYDHVESMLQAVDKVVRFIQWEAIDTDECFAKLRDWIEGYLAATEPYPEGWYDCYSKCRDFWKTIPKLVAALSWRSRYFGRFLDNHRAGRRTLVEFLCQFSRLTGRFVTMDVNTLAKHAQMSESDEVPDLPSCGYLNTYSHLVRKHDSSHIGRNLEQHYGWNWEDEAPALVDSFRNHGGSIQALTKLVEGLLRLIPRNPKIIDSLTDPCYMASWNLVESVKVLDEADGNRQQYVDIARHQAEHAHEFFRVMSPALVSIIEKHVTFLTKDSAMGIVDSLTYILRQIIHFEIPSSRALVIKTRQEHPELHSDMLSSVISLEWKFTILHRLITSTQMQLRVGGATTMCAELLRIFNEYKEFEVSQSPHLLYFANFIIQNKIIEYLVGIGSHPEIINESNNILGFLIVTKTYEESQVATIWHTVSKSQDPRVVEAILRMLKKCFGLQEYHQLLDLCEKLNTLPIEAFTPVMREFCETLFREIAGKAMGTSKQYIEPPPYELCIRLIRESSQITPELPVGYPEIQTFAAGRFRDLLSRGPHSSTRDEIYLSCIGDVSARTATAPGSICVINSLLQQNIATDLRRLTTEHGLTQLLIQELESSIVEDHQSSNPSIRESPASVARRELLHNIIRWEPGTISPSHGAHLWNLLVGSESRSITDRTIWWRVLNSAIKCSSANNVFLAACFKDHLPTLPPDCFTIGALDFVRGAIWTWLERARFTFIEEDATFESPALDQLWRMILQAPPNTIDAPAIVLLVEVYVESQLILSLPREKARTIHLALVDRCLKQLAAAATKLKGSNYDGGSHETGDSMIVDDPKSEFENEEMIFARSLAVLREFLRAYQSKPQFAAPKPRPPYTSAPSSLEGDPLTIKYQSFDGNTRTEIKNLTLGKANTTASLFASLQKATGFKSYKVYCGGKEYDPNEIEVYKSLEDLNLNGLVLVQRRDDTDGSIGQGTDKPTLEAEITKHFDELWGYLGMHEKVAQEIYVFLVTFPAYDCLQQDFDSDTVLYSEIFPQDQPYKTSYAVHALREYVTTKSQKGNSNGAAALTRAISLIVSAISDENILDSCQNEQLRDTLSVQLVDYFIDLLKEPVLPVNVSTFLNDGLLSRLLRILHRGMSAAPRDSFNLISKCFEAVLEASLHNPELWNSFKLHISQSPLLPDLLLDSSPSIRKSVAKQIVTKCTFTPSLSTVSKTDFTIAFWPLISQLIPSAVRQPQQCEEFFSLCISVLRSLGEISLDSVNLEGLVREWASLLLDHTTTERIGVPESVDFVAQGLANLCHCAVMFAKASQQPLACSTIGTELFQQHLFPELTEVVFEDMDITPKVPILTTSTRHTISETIFFLVRDDPAQYKKILSLLSNLLPYEGQHDGPYAFDLPYYFERERSIRSRTGYVGLRNLSNTCYLNSLFTQLFMNLPFRKFMLDARVADGGSSQKLLSETQQLFSYMQNSLRRFVDPASVAMSIKTYEDSNIDVSIQMDVDEFYNLLFDRWEGQILAPEAKKQFKSFYGGHLVQQVKSKECPHISERLEPFSAIQCDIKGKSCLEESLQAYVDGEVMEGDNKYKCSTCDRHVDAVKRACLKDVPDNLIFHLKRFDYNLLKQQRSKINDYFSFPPKIDMRPYKIEHFSATADESAEDIFELVGVLVHSGTAESGHYYSYIRERPSSSDKPNWVEFNDDMVTSWDPSNMESSCFGGFDFQSQVISNGNTDKSFSAYMLMYQRSSTLTAQKQSLKNSPHRSPLRLPVPTQLSNHIAMENELLMRKYCLYDPSHSSFVTKILSNIKHINKGRCSQLHELEKSSLVVALNHLDQVVSRSKDTPDFISSMLQVRTICNSCAECSRDFLEWFCERPETLRNLLLRNPEVLVRTEMASSIISALLKVKAEIPYAYGLIDDEDGSDAMDSEEPRLVQRVVETVYKLWDQFHVSCRAWPEYFGLLHSIAKLGDQEAVILLDYTFLRKALEVVCADGNLNTSLQYTRMLNTVNKRGATRPVSYEAVINLLFSLIEVCDLEAQPLRIEARRLEVGDEDRGPVPLTKIERELMVQHWTRGYAHILTEKLLQLNQNHNTTKHILTTLLHTKKLQDSLDMNIYQAITHGIRKGTSPIPCGPFLRAAITYCEQSEREDAISRMVTYVARAANHLDDTEGREVLQFFNDVLLLQEDSNANGITHEEILGLVVDLVPIYAPCLLADYDFAVREGSERLLGDILFTRSSQEEVSSEDEQEKTEHLVTVAQKLGVSCLNFLQERFIAPRQSAVRATIEVILGVIEVCASYYDPDEKDSAFFQKRQSILPALKKLTVEEAEEDGTDWTDGEYESEPMDGITDLVSDELDAI